MKPWLNWALFMMVFLVIVHSIVVNSRMYLAGSRWQAGRQIGNTAQNKNQPSCLKVSDFYSVHLTTYFLAATGLGDMDPKDKAKRHIQVCDRIPGTGQVVFTVDLMEQDTRGVPVGFSLSRYDTGGRLVLVKEASREVHPRGVLTLDAAIAEQGKYLLKVAFGEAKTKDDIIEIPVLVGQ
jgi:hypothetical protein